MTREGLELPNEPGMWVDDKDSMVVVRELRGKLEFAGYYNIGRCLGRVDELPKGNWHKATVAGEGV